MSLIIALGSNIGERKSHLETALEKLKENFKLIAASRIYSSPAVDYENQPDFYNQVLEFQLPTQKPSEVIQFCLETERSMGRRRDIPKGPRTIDIDIIFWGTEQIDIEGLTVPHPHWSERSFVVYPLQELPYFETLAIHYKIPEKFSNKAIPL